MELEQTDQEQVEALQTWWRENWLSLVSGLVLGLGAILGWQYYGEYTLNQAAQASQSYESIKNKLAAGQLEAAQADLTQLVANHKSSAYAAQGHFAMAEAQANAGTWAAAESSLRVVLESSSDHALLGLARLRLARALWAQDKADDALATLAAADEAAYAPLYAELKGDIARDQKNFELARVSYTEALAADRDYVDRDAIQRKLEALN